jgi:serine/threonine-protein kinase
MTHQDDSDEPASSSPCVEQIGRYRVLGEVARGGMGAVLRVHDPTLGRTLALKVLLEQRQDQPAMARRFLEEAQIGGQLQHPGIVPVHELGQLDDGRPFFTMKLVKGRTLAELLRERTDPATELPRFLQVFEQVCQTIAYAHSRGIIHRDLKPSNIMVGNFGEVQVMDWGLAKVLGQGPTEAVPAASAGASTMFTSRTSDDSATQAGTVLGTPAYMPPEQARGQVTYLDERCDVFGLGAILCEILTGAPPYIGSREEILLQAAQGDVTSARSRLESCGADAELMKLALQCLAYQPLERPRDAAAVAGAVIAYRAGVQERAQQAELDRAAARTRAVEERKRRRLVLTLGAVVVVALVAGGWAWLRQSQKRLALEQEAIAALDKAALLQQEGKWSDALAQARQAEGLLPAIGDWPELRQRIEDRIAEIELVQQFDRIRNPATDSSQRLRTRHQADAAYTAAFRKFGIDVDDLPPADVAKRIAALPALKSHLITALDDWVLPRRYARPDEPASWKRLLEAARATDPDPWRDRLRRAVASDNLPELMQIAQTADLEAPVSTLQLLADWLLQAEERDTAIALLRRVQWQHPSDFWINFRLAAAQRFRYDTPLQIETPRLEESLRCCAMAVALRPDSGLAWYEYGLALSCADRLDDAIDAAKRAVELLGEHGNPCLLLASCLRRKGNLDGMRREYRRGLNNARRAVAQDQLDLAAWDGLGDALAIMGNREEAVQAYLKTATLVPDRAVQSFWKGRTLTNYGRSAEAIPCFKEALRRNPRLGTAASGMAAAFVKLGQLDQGVAWSRKVLQMPNVDRGGAWNDLAFHLLEKGEPVAEAERAIAEALRVCSAYDCFVLTQAEVRRAQGRFADSLDAFRRGHKLHQKAWQLKWPTEQWIKEAERRVELDKQWPDIQKGERKPASAAEYAEFGHLCVYKGLFAASARLYQQAFSFNVKLADDLGAGHRYEAARAAAMAGCGHDAENDNLDDTARTRWRKQARDWMSADLALRRTQLASRKAEDRRAALYALNHCRTHDHLAGIRDASAIARLPKAEQAECQKLWTEVESLLKQSQQPKQ